MRLKFPKSNVAWEVIDDEPRGYGRRVAIRASFAMPDGEVCHVQNEFDKYMLSSAAPGFTDHIVEHSLRELERAVGRKMVRG
jgi:hypothetical protein